MILTSVELFSGALGAGLVSQHGARRLLGDALRRRLTVEECSALQSFPKDWPFRGTKTSRYRQAGNACPPPLVEAIARRVREALEEDAEALAIRTRIGVH